jgi:hypothetical protein
MLDAKGPGPSKRHIDCFWSRLLFSKMIHASVVPATCTKCSSYLGVAMSIQSFAVSHLI